MDRTPRRFLSIAAMYERSGMSERADHYRAKAAERFRTQALILDELLAEEAA